METDVIRWARKAGIDAESDTLCRYEGWVEPLERFAAIVRADEREQCAKVCEDTDIVEFQHCMVLHEDAAKTLRNAAAAIRARSHVQQEPQSKD